MNAPSLTEADLAEMRFRALRACPDLDDDEAVVAHLHALGLSVTRIGEPLAEQLDRARASRAPVERRIA